MSDRHRNSTRAESWLAKADEDLTTARLVYEVVGPYSSVCFHSQQAVEKALKGFLLAHGVRYRPVHELPLLLSMCAEIEPDFVGWMDEAELLAPYYVEARYPAEPLVTYPRQVAEKALRAAERLYQFVREKLGMWGGT